MLVIKREIVSKTHASKKEKHYNGRVSETQDEILLILTLFPSLIFVSEWRENRFHIDTRIIKREKCVSACVSEDKREVF